MNLTKLKNRVTIQRPVKTSDSMGGFTTTTWADVDEVWAAIWPVSAKQMITNERPATEITHRIRIRFRNGIRSSYRVKHKVDYFSIFGRPIPTDDGIWLDMLCKGVI